jgi:UDP-2,3-diacylglucosamine hydrolase
MSALFVSDLHLCEARPEIAQLFFDFLDTRVKGKAQQLYILGDLFEYWIGDEDLEQPFNYKVAAAIRAAADSGTRVFLMHGNRDFLLGPRFCAEAGATLLTDPTLIDLYGTPTLLLHGDTLCSDDLAYQGFRKMVRNEQWQQGFLALPVEARRAQAQAVRNRSEADKQTKSESIMDVNAGAVDAAFQQHNYPRMIHGHTHRPAHHRLQVAGNDCERWVLQDWYLDGGYLQCDAGGCQVLPLPTRVAGAAGATGG